MNFKDKCFIQVSYSEDRDVCTFPKGNRFENVRVLEDQCGVWWIHGIGYLGCHTWVELTSMQKEEIRLMLCIK